MAMRLRYVTLLMGLFICNLAVAQTGVIALTKASDINDARQLEQALDKVTAKVMQCVHKKLAPPQSCHCLYPKPVSNLKRIYKKVLRVHPDWQDKAVSYIDAQNKFGHTISLFALHRQFGQKCKK